MPIAQNLSHLQTRLIAAAAKVGRDPASIRLMAVTKGIDAMRIQEALEAGQRLFGENYVQEAKAKWPELLDRYPDTELHFIGPLQTNKVKEALRIFQVIHTLDRPSLAEALAGAIGKQQKAPALLIEVNIGAEPQKHGCLPQALPALLDQACQLGLNVKGLMTVPPADQPPAPCFQQLAGLARNHLLPELSMGMSGDFEDAIAEGATIIRIGTALFGERVKKR